MNTEKRAVDRRVIRTKKAIKNAFAKLLTEKEINDITISDIAAEADINRKTFYNYYSGIHEVVDEIENDIISHVDEALTEVDFKNSLKRPYQIFEKLTSVINTDMEFFGYLLSSNSNVSLSTKIADLLKAKMKAVVIPYSKLEEKQLDLVFEYTISGLVAVYRRWFNSDRSMPVEEISSRINTLTLKGVDGFINLES